MKCYRFLAFVFVSVLLSASLAYAFSWETIENLPPGYSTNYYLDVYFHPSNTNYGWVCGFNGKVVRTTNGGKNWIGSQVTGANHLESIHFPTLTTGYTSGVEGIFKTVDGGDTWFGVTPTDAVSLWGCYFLNANWGLVVGDGCVGNQSFYLTTDGGQNWSLFELHEPFSGMTDLMLYPNGLGYASGSGIIYKTLDSGRTWEIFRNTGTKIWQEEITNYNSSFLVPTSGDNCNGGGPVGGMRFSVNDGIGWRDFTTPNSMFGSFLIDANKGWVCGYSKLVYYTSDGGQNWRMNNCGIDEGNLDDIWFNSPTDGWVVGEGIWKLAPDKLHMSDSNMKFGSVCVPYSKLDSIYIKNKSFDDALVDLSITGLNASSFSLVTPNALQLNLSSCDSLLVVVEFSPTSMGEKTATLNFSYNGKPYYCLLSGKGSEATAILTTDSVNLGNILCAKDYYANANWTATQTETITGYSRLIIDTNVNIYSRLPQSINSGAATTIFKVNALDTGRVFAKYLLSTEPCSQAHFYTVEAYAYSPIINSEAVDISKKCYKDSIIAVPIYNTGNDTLKIASLHLSDSTNWSVIGWKSNSQMPVNILSKRIDTLYLKFSAINSGRYSLVLNLENNDSTKIRGNKNPFKIYVSEDLDKTDIYPKTIDIDFGDVCINQDSSIVVGFSNKGSITAGFQSVTNNLSDIAVTTVNGGSDDSLKYRIKFSPKALGDIADTVCLTFVPCLDKVYVRLLGNGIGGNIEATPNKITDNIQKGIEEDYTIQIRSFANIPANIKAITITPPQPEMLITFDRSTPFVLDADSTKTIGMKIKATNDTIVNFNICFETDTKCMENLCIPVEITSTSRLLALSKTKCDFDTVYCSPQSIFDTVYVKNLGIAADTVINITLSGSKKFSIIEKPDVPYYVQSGDSIRIIISYLPSAEEKSLASLLISSKDPDGQNLSVSLVGVFTKSIISLDKTVYDFGRFEYCEEDILREIKIYNTGTHDDYVNLSIESNPLITIQPDRVLVKAADSAMVILKLTVMNASALGKFEYTLTAVSDLCGQTVTAKVIGEFIRPALTITPDALDLGNVWIGRNDSEFSVIKNIGQDTISIIGIEPVGSSYFTITNSRYKLAGGDTSLVTALFQSEADGKYNSEYRIIYKSKCLDTLYLNVTANTPEEVYWANLRIGDYTAEISEIIDVKVSLDTALPNFAYTGAKFNISFDRNLLYPMNLKVWNGTDFVENTFERIETGMKFDFGSALANAALTKQGDFAIIPCLALASLPTYTDIIISEFIPGTNKIINYTKDDGSFLLKEFCYAEYLGGFMLISSVTSNKIAYTSNAVRISSITDGAIGANVEIYNYLGDVIFSRRYSLGKGENTIEIPMSSYGQGYYILRMSSDINQQWVEKLMIVR